MPIPLLKTCKECGDSLPVEDFRPFTSRGKQYRSSFCYSCFHKRRKESKRRWENRHPEKAKEQKRRQSANYRSDPERRLYLNEQCRAWGRNNKDYKRRKMAEWEAANMDKVRANRAKTRESYPPEHFRETSRRSYQNNRASICESRRKARAEGRYDHFRLKRAAKLRCAPGFTNASLLAQKLKYYGNKCRYCKVELQRSNRTFDHAMPLSRGGSNWTANLLPACRSCNSSKNTLTFKEFMESDRR